jgi:hypothetical protein
MTAFLSSIRSQIWPMSQLLLRLRQPLTGRRVLLFKHRKIDPIASLPGLCPSYEFRLRVIPLADESLVSCGRWHDPHVCHVTSRQ